MNFTQEQLEQMAIDYLDIKENLKNASDSKKIRTLKIKQENIIKNLKCLVNIRSFRYKKFSNFPDLEQEGLEALIMALNTFKPNRSSFTWWADKYISTRLSRSANAHSTVRVPIKHAKESKPLKSSIIPLIIDERNGYSELEIKDIEKRVIEAVNKLPEINKKFISMLYGLNGIRQYNITQLCEKFSLNKSESMKLINESKKKLKNILQTYESV
jgi:DNA-directed RNA polymerase specialized sigma subunit